MFATQKNNYELKITNYELKILNFKSLNLKYIYVYRNCRKNRKNCSY